MEMADCFFECSRDFSRRKDIVRESTGGDLVGEGGGLVLVEGEGG